MAGGLVLMGALAFVLPVSAAFVTHGILQLVANGWRAVLHRQHVAWRIIANYALASAAAAGVIALVSFAPSRPLLFLLLGLVPMLVWLPRHWIQLDAAKTPHALISGFLVTLVNLTAGVAGPLLDIFFVRTALTRHQIVATKAATQVFSHLAKILVYGTPPLLDTAGWAPPLDPKYAWEAETNGDGSTTLILKVFPFFYNVLSTDAQFYPDFTFEVGPIRRR